MIFLLHLVSTTRKWNHSISAFVSDLLHVRVRNSRSTFSHMFSGHQDMPHMCGHQDMDMPRTASASMRMHKHL